MEEDDASHDKNMLFHLDAVRDFAYMAYLLCIVNQGAFGVLARPRCFIAIVKICILVPTNLVFESSRFLTMQLMRRNWCHSLSSVKLVMVIEVTDRWEGSSARQILPISTAL